MTLKRPPHFVANVEALLERRGWSAAELARRAGVAPRTLDRLLSGRPVPRLLDVLERVADACGFELWQMHLPQLPPESPAEKAGRVVH